MNNTFKILIHVGLPKTATTTLQNGLFPELHKDDLINYLGICNASLKKSNYSVSDDFCKHFVNSIASQINPLNFLDSSKLNIFSWEGLTAIDYTLQKRGFKTSVDLAPEVIKNYFYGHNIEMKILLVIRNQQSWIQSNYCQAYHVFKTDKNKKNINVLMKNFQTNKTIYSDRKYNKLIDNWAKGFGQDNIKVLFYEDFLYDKDRFIRELSEIIKVPFDTIKNHLTNKHFNKKEKTSDGTIINAKRTKIVDLFKTIFPENTYIFKFYQNLKNRSENNVMIKFYRNLINKSAFIRKLTDNEKLLIFKEFKASNNLLWQEYGVDKERLKKYKYI